MEMAIHVSAEMEFMTWTPNSKGFGGGWKEVSSKSSLFGNG